MKKILPLLLVLVAGLSYQAKASHDLGGSLTYQCVAPNIYVVKYSHYSWYSMGQTNSYDLNLSAPGCHGSRIVPMQFQSTYSAGVLPYNGTTNAYNVADFVATVTFTAAEAACADWVLSVSTSFRTGGRNLSPNQFNLLNYTETTLKLNGNLNNSSPVFDLQNPPILLAAPYQPITLSVSATDPDGDSLAYSMATPMKGANQPITNYAPLGNISTLFINPNPLPPYTTTPPNVQYAAMPQMGSHYSPGFPLPSYTADWNQINPATGIPFPVVQATPYFELDPVNGNVSFMPMPVDTINQYYVVAFKVDEYRKINGVATKIGSIRRETFIFVGSSPGNQNPVLANRQMNNTPVQANASVTILPGATFTYQTDASDANSADSVYLVSNATTALPGATFTVTSARQQSATVTWTPTAAEVRDQPYFLRIWVKDNASPFAGRHVETVAVRVSNTGGVTGTKDERKFNAGFTAFPNPFNEQVNFKFNAPGKAESILIYNLLGQQLDAIAIPQNASGEQHIQWNNASKHAAGIYIAKLVAKDKTIQTLKFTKVQ